MSSIGDTLAAFVARNRCERLRLATLESSENASYPWTNVKYASANKLTIVTVLYHHEFLMRFGMTGGLKYYRDTDEEPAHARVLISFRNGSRLAFGDQRLFGKVDLIEDPDGYVEEHKLGPDPLDLDYSAFRKRLEGRRGEIKATLMNQRVFAGIGNIYSDEILFQVRLHPKTSVGRLDESSLHNLHEQIRRVLRAAIERGAEPGGLPDSVLLLHRQEGADCPRGNGKVQKTKAAGRTAYYCPTCQPRV